MKIEIHYASANTAAKIHFEAGDEITSEAGSMISMSSNISIETSTHQKNAKKGGILSGIKRIFSGESFFLNHYKAHGPSELWLSATLPGDMKVFDLSGTNLVVQSGSFVACESGVNIDLGWQGFKSMFSGESLFWLKTSGQGQLVASSFGNIYEVDVEDEYVVDTGHIVAFEETLSFDLSKAGSSWIHSILGGEGIVCRFKGKGKVWCQSHHEQSFGYALQPMLRPKKS